MFSDDSDARSRKMRIYSYDPNRDAASSKKSSSEMEFPEPEPKFRSQVKIPKSSRKDSTKKSSSGVNGLFSDDSSGSDYENFGV